MFSWEDSVTFSVTLESRQLPLFFVFNVVT